MVSFLIDRVVAEAEMDQRRLARDDAALGEELAHLHAGGGFDAQLGADAVEVRRAAGELDDDAVTGRRCCCG